MVSGLLIVVLSAWGCDDQASPTETTDPRLQEQLRQAEAEVAEAQAAVDQARLALTKAQGSDFEEAMAQRDDLLAKEKQLQTELNTVKAELKEVTKGYEGLVLPRKVRRKAIPLERRRFQATHELGQVRQQLKPLQRRWAQQEQPAADLRAAEATLAEAVAKRNAVAAE